ncbi:MAG: Pyruvate, phosphate dikinase [Phycisphaerae bacterium]|nr:Pyruvate, phosphate dikinase [Phycisphaerae bacterium]
MAAAGKLVYSFGRGKAEGRGDQKLLLGGKGAGLAEMTRIGLPVPAGFTITTTTCEAYLKSGGTWPRGLEAQIRDGVRSLERLTKKKLGGAKDPLLVSVRSGAARSMPGMMETILNLGLNDDSVEGLAKVSGNRRFAFDSYRRFITMYGATARGVERHKFDAAFDRVKEEVSRPRLARRADEAILDTDVNAEELERLVGFLKNIYRETTGEEFPQDPFDQLRGAINAVFSSWNAEKAVTYRRVENIADLNGTAVNVVQMVFGNMGDDSGTGVCFTRDPSTGERVFYGDLLINAQGEDVVAGIRTPVPLDRLRELMPEAYDQLEAVRVMLEVHYQDMQDLEFTIERGTLYMLQCRSGKRSPAATFKIAVDQATTGVVDAAAARRLVRMRYLPARYAKAASKPILTRAQAVQRITPTDIERLFYPIIDPGLARDALDRQLLCEGINAVPGAAGGQVVFSAHEAERRAAAGTAVVLVRKETSPEDVGGMHAAAGILTATGGKTSHAAVVARGWGKCCIVGCGALNIDERARTVSVNGRTLREGDAITLDGTSGRVYQGSLALVRPTAPPEFETLLSWCDDLRRLRVRTNADTPEDARRAVEFGAEGIGLCRTEHMFFATTERQLAIQEMIVAESVEQRVAALGKLLPYQREDFVGIFEAMDGRPVTIRLIDPPLHEFVPKSREQAEALARVTGLSAEHILRRSEQLHESNPMLGHRGCRLCITYPEILDMQVRAIIEAALQCRSRGTPVAPEIMIPLTMDGKEMRLLADRVRDVAERVIADGTAGAGFPDSLAASSNNGAASSNAGAAAMHKRSASPKSAAPSKKSGRGSRAGRLNYLVGTMIEVPRAALLADEVAAVSDFFSFGTNDLTQMTMGLSRDDAGRFLPDYVDKDKTAVFPADPFQSLDAAGVGKLVDLACRLGRQTRRNLKLGVCGEHGGDPDSIRFFNTVGLDYVSCSPFRVPVARLAAAQATLAERGGARTSTSRSHAKDGGKKRAKPSNKKPTRAR